MIPTEAQAKALWEKYQLPEKKRIHVTLVAKIADDFAQQINKLTNLQINRSLLLAAALLHDIDKAADKRLGEQHPDAAVRILHTEGMPEVAALVATHSLHMILDPIHKPTTWEEKLLFLADKMVKYEVIGVDKRFAMWAEEPLSEEAREILEKSYRKVKELEREIAKLASVRYT